MAKMQYMPVPQQRGRGGCIALFLLIAMVGVCVFLAPMVQRYSVKTLPPQPKWYVDLQHKTGKFQLPSLPAAFAAGVDPSKLVATTVARVHTAPSVNTATGDLSIYSAPTLTGAQIDTILAEHHSPAAGTGQDIHNLGILYGIDPAFALAFFQHESSWGLAGMARATHSPGNIRCYPGVACYQGYVSFSNWTAGFNAWYALLAGPVYKGSGLTTVAQIIPKYAPREDNNDVPAYIASVLASVQQFRNEVHA